MKVDKQFLINRKFKVVPNKCMSEEGDVRTGVPKDKVLAAVLLAIMISDRDENNEIELCKVELVRYGDTIYDLWMELFTPETSKRGGGMVLRVYQKNLLEGSCTYLVEKSMYIFTYARHIPVKQN